MLIAFVLCLSAVSWSSPIAAGWVGAPEAGEAERPESEPASERVGNGVADEEEAEGVVKVIEIFGTVFSETAWWGWVALFVFILSGLVAGKVAQAVIRRSGERWQKNGWAIRGGFFNGIASPTSLGLLTVGVTIGLRWIVMPAELTAFTWDAVKLLYMIAIGWFVYNLVDLVDIGLRRATRAESNKLAAQLAPLIRKALRIFVLVIFTLVIAQNVFGVNITAWLAGLGIAGLAISLASQDSIRNLFGSVTVMLDKPFGTGDRIVFSGTEGFVEEIGLRSTRIRTFAGHLVTVPNMRFIDGTVENVSKRSFLRRAMNVTITYDTPVEKIDEALRLIKRLLAAEDIAAPFRIEERPPRVFFNDFNADSLNISVSYWYFLDAEKGHDWWHYQEHAETFNRRLIAAFAEAGIEFAFPTQTLYLAGDPARRLAVHTMAAGADGQRV